jgi:hypothetical protein
MRISISNKALKCNFKIILNFYQISSIKKVEKKYKGKIL